MLANPKVGLALRRDARDIAELSRDVIEHGLDWNYNQARILKAIECESTNVAVMHERGRLLAFGIMDYGDTTAHLVLLGVQPTQRRRGLGRYLVMWLEKSAITAGIERIRVEARADNPIGIAFYGSLGFNVCTRFPGYYSGIVDAVRLEKRLGVGAK